MKKLLSLITLAAISCSAQASSTGMRPYIGIDYSAMFVKLDQASYESILTGNRQAVSPYVGLLFNQYIGIEFTYFQTNTDTKTNVFGFSGLNADTDFSGYSAAIVGQFPLPYYPSFRLIGSVGATRDKFKLRIYGLPGEQTESIQDTSYQLGAGCQYQLTPHLGLRLMERYSPTSFNSPQNSGPVSKFILLTNLGLNYEF